MTRKDALPDVGRRLAWSRMQRGLSQGTVARLAGIAPSYLSRIETGKVQPTFRTVMRVANSLKIEMGDLASPAPADPGHAGACPISTTGRCMLDLIRSEGRAGRVATGEIYSPREIRLLQRLADWLQEATPDRLRAMEVLLDDLLRGAAKPEERKKRRRSRT
jgi:transcriptional regulator with XRE-family HTH domain